MSCEKSASIVAFEFLGLSASTSEILRRGGVAGLSTATAWWSSSTTTSRPCRTFSNAAAKFFRHFRLAHVDLCHRSDHSSSSPSAASSENGSAPTFASPAAVWRDGDQENRRQWKNILEHRRSALTRSEVRPPAGQLNRRFGPQRRQGASGCLAKRTG